jgi:hypothetical protein
MFDELNKYKGTGHFPFAQTDNLSQVCNAPTDQSGVYLVYTLQDDSTELIYIGCSGRIRKDGSMFIRTAGFGGLKDRLVNGHQFGKIPRRKSWPNQMKIENMEELDIYWYATHNEKYQDCPRELEKSLLKKYFAIYRRLPKWNKEF